MKRKSYGRDFGLSVRMLFTGGLLGLLYVIFALVLFQVLNVGLAPMLVIIVGIAVVQYYTSDKLALAASGAKVVSPEEAPELHAMVERLCALADLPKPRVAIIPTDVPNAFATGRNPKHAAVAVTRGPLAAPRAAGGRGGARARALARGEPRRPDHDARELLRHARRRSSRVSASTAACSAASEAAGRRDSNGNNGVPIWLIIFAVSIVTYAISYVLIRTISRYREYAADRGSALMTGAPENLMSALQKISSGITQIPQQDLREVVGDERLLHHLDELARAGRRALHGSPAAREAARRARGDLPRDGQAV